MVFVEYIYSAISLCGSLFFGYPLRGVTRLLDIILFKRDKPAVNENENPTSVLLDWIYKPYI